MSRKLTIALLTAIFLTAPAASALATCQGDKCIRDGAAKGQANEGAFHPQTHGQPGMAVKNGGVPQNGMALHPPDRPTTVHCNRDGHPVACD